MTTGWFGYAKNKNFFTGGEGLNWALDEDLKLLKKSSYNYLNAPVSKILKSFFQFGQVD